MAKNYHIYDYVIIGGGIVGFSTALQLKQALPDAKIALLEKESGHSFHQTGRNSGVIHAGVYYKPGSLKADFCRRGSIATMTFCDEHGINYDQCGKLIVATNQKEVEQLADLKERCQLNGLTVDSLDRQQLKEKEPLVTGEAALFIYESGIVDYKNVVQTMMSLFTAAGGDVWFNAEVEGIVTGSSSVIIRSRSGNFQAGYLINCAGVAADRIVAMSGITPDFRIVPFRGDYYQLPKQFNQAFKHLIYPVPDPDLPFLGVHLTKMIDGSVTVGPNAALSLARFGYDKLSVNLKDMSDTFLWPGFWSILVAHTRSTLDELRCSFSKEHYLSKVAKYTQAVSLSDLKPYPSGIRAQAVSRTGQLMHDFHFMQTDNSLHVCNAPSPAATSAFPIGEHIVRKVLSSSS